MVHDMGISFALEENNKKSKTNKVDFAFFENTGTIIITTESKTRKLNIENSQTEITLYNEKVSDKKIVIENSRYGHKSISFSLFLKEFNDKEEFLEAHRKITKFQIDFETKRNNDAQLTITED